MTLTDPQLRRFIGREGVDRELRRLFGAKVVKGSGPADNEILKYDASSDTISWEADTGGGGGASELSDLSDVDSATQTDTFVMQSTGGNYFGAQLDYSDLSGSAPVPTTITVADEGTDTTCFPLFVTAATGDLAPKSDASALTYNSSSGELGMAAANVNGDLTISGDIVGDGTGMSITGGDTDGETVTLQSNSADFSDSIVAESPLEMFASGPTWTAKPTVLGVIAAIPDTTTLTMNYGGAGVSGTIDFSAISFRPTIEFASGKNILLLGGPKLFFNRMTVRNSSGNAESHLANMWGMADYPIFNANNANHSLSTIYGYDHRPRLTRTTSGTATVTTIHGVTSQLQVNDNSVVTNRRGLVVNAATTNGTGTVTNEIGLAMEALDTSVSTNSTLIRLGAITAASGDWGIYDDSGTDWYLNGPIIRVGTGAPSFSAAQGSLFIRTDGGSGTTIYANHDGSTGWHAL